MFAAIDPQDIVGKRFGKLTVESYVGKQLRGKTIMHIYSCRCDCGTSAFEAGRQSLLNGGTKSCGCAHRDAGNRICEDLSGQRFGRWTVISRAPNRVSKSGITRSIMWNCRCDCGTEKVVGARALKTGMSLSCGCFQKENISKIATVDLTGQRFAHLEVLYRNGSWKSNRSSSRAVWHCRCDCGNECDVIGELLRNGDVTSCGCSHTSKYEGYVVQYLESLGYILDVTFFREKTFSGLVGINGGALRFDFFVKLKSGEDVLIECQGLQHYKSTEWFGGDAYLARLQQHDSIKRKFAEQHKIRLIEVPYTKVTYELISEFLKQAHIV